MFKPILALVLSVTSVSAQIVNFETTGNLAATHDIGCIPLSQVAPHYSPADLFKGIEKCHRKRDYDKAAELMLMAQLRGEFDKKRVKDKSAHQAVAVLSLNMANQGGKRWERGIGKAFESFGRTGSERHTAFCKVAARSGPPTHSPSYMVQHGLKAFMGNQGTGLVKGFRAQKAWADAMKSYLRCS
ncbi:MAG: hypothetical protein ACRBBQ_11590 [Cognatishimia sp.]